MTAPLSNLAQHGITLTKFPLEIRYHIYSYLIISSNSILIRGDGEDAFLYLRLQDGEGGNSFNPNFICAAIPNSYLASEVYEGFYRNNTFDCEDPRSLPVLLRETRTEPMSPSPINDIPGYQCAMMGQFDKSLLIRHLKVALKCKSPSIAAAQQLVSVLGCADLKSLEMTLQRPGHFYGLGLTNFICFIKKIARECNMIRARIGDGLHIYVGDYGSVATDRVWMKWREPDEGIMARVDAGTGSIDDETAVLMASGCFSREANNRYLGKLWMGRHFEMEDSKRKAGTGVWSFVA